MFKLRFYFQSELPTKRIYLGAQETKQIQHWVPKMSEEFSGRYWWRSVQRSIPGIYIWFHKQTGGNCNYSVYFCSSCSYFHHHLYYVYHLFVIILPFYRHGSLNPCSNRHLPSLSEACKNFIGILICQFQKWFFTRS